MRTSVWSKRLTRVHRAMERRSAPGTSPPVSPPSWLQYIAKPMTAALNEFMGVNFLLINVWALHPWSSDLYVRLVFYTWKTIGLLSWVGTVFFTWCNHLILNIPRKRKAAIFIFVRWTVAWWPCIAGNRGGNPKPAGLVQSSSGMFLVISKLALWLRVHLALKSHTGAD